MKWISYQFSSVAQSYLTLCDPQNSSTLGLLVHHQLPELTQTHIHRVGDAIQPSHPLSSPSPPAPNPSQHQSLFQWVSSSREVAKVLEFQLQHQSFQWTPRMLDLLAVQGTLKSLFQHHSSKASILRRSAFFTVQLSHPYMTTGETICVGPAKNSAPSPTLWGCGPVSQLFEIGIAGWSESSLTVGQVLLGVMVSTPLCCLKQVGGPVCSSLASPELSSPWKWWLLSTCICSKASKRVTLRQAFKGRVSNHAVSSLKSRYCLVSTFQNKSKFRWLIGRHWSALHQKIKQSYL